MMDRRARGSQAFEVVPLLADCDEGRMVRGDRGLEELDGPGQRTPGCRRVATGAFENPEVDQRGTELGMALTEHTGPDVEAATVARRGLIEAALAVVDRREIVQGDGHLVMVATENSLEACKRILQVLVGLVGSSEGLDDGRQGRTIEGDGEVVVAKGGSA